jgi:plasmid maintenance system antidote protein VapI
MDQSLTKLLRTAIAEFEPGHNELARQSGVPQPTITRFVNGADIKLSTVDKLAAHLGIGFTRRKSRRKL